MKRAPDRPIYRYQDGSEGSPTPSPNEHVRMLVELMRPAGPDLARRWLAALLLVDADDREALVAAIEARAAALYERKGGGADVAAEFDVVHPPVARAGYVERVTTTYSVEAKPEPAKKARPSRRGAGGAPGG